MNRLYFGDNLKWLSDRKEFPDASVDLVYIDSPFNSSADYNDLNNADVAIKLSDAQNADSIRYDLYYADGKDNPGLLECLRLMKSYVAGEFGRGSELYKQVVALKV